MSNAGIDARMPTEEEWIQGLRWDLIRHAYTIYAQAATATFPTPIPSFDKNIEKRKKTGISSWEKSDTQYQKSHAIMTNYIQSVTKTLGNVLKYHTEQLRTLGDKEKAQLTTAMETLDFKGNLDKTNVDFGEIIDKYIDKASMERIKQLTLHVLPELEKRRREPKRIRKIIAMFDSPYVRTLMATAQKLGFLTGGKTYYNLPLSKEKQAYLKKYNARLNNAKTPEQRIYQQNIKQSSIVIYIGDTSSKLYNKINNMCQVEHKTLLANPTSMDPLKVTLGTKTGHDLSLFIVTEKTLKTWKPLNMAEWLQTLLETNF